ncbi:MAG: TonB-dependent receptor [Bacteroidetes bacterium]|nr:TonB-dependent receptor [Bacteroidota bacterium]
MKLKLYFISTLFLFSGSMFAQNELAGKIKNKKNGAALVSTSVFISDLQLGALSDAEGNYSFKNVPAGTYLVEVSHIGFASIAREVVIQNETSFDFEMEESRIELNEVIVTGFASATEKQSTPIPVSVIHQKDFMQSSATNIIDALSATPGVSQITNGPSISKPVIRGLGYNRVVVVNDGIRQEGQQWGDEFGIEVDEYSINRVEIYKGPASLRYGSDAMAGVINMIAAPAVPDGTIKGNVLLNYQTNNGLFGTSINLAGNNKGLFWDVRYSRKQAHAYKNKNDGYVWNSGYSENDWKGTIGINRKWGYSHLTASSFDLQLGIIEGVRDSATGKFITDELTPSGPEEIIAPDDKYKSYSYFPIIHQHVQHYKLVWDNNLAVGKGFLGVRFGYQENFRREANDPEAGDVYNNYFFLRTGNYDLRYVFSEKKKFELSVGANGMVQASEDRGTVFLVPEYNLFDLGLYTIAKKSFNKLSLSGGLRFDSRLLHGKDLYTDSGNARINGPAVNSIHRFTAYNSDFSGVSASVGAAYDFSSNWYGKLNFARGYRAPNIAESGSNGIHDGTPFYEIGDAKLKAESSLQVDATIGYFNPDVSLELNAFVNNIDNYIFPVKLASKKGGDSLRYDPTVSFLEPAPTFKFVQGDAVLSGGEAMLNIHPRSVNWFSWFNSLSMVNAIQKNQSDSSKYLPYTPPYKLRSEVRLGLPGNGETLKNAYFKLGIDHFFEQSKVYYKYGNETITPAYTLLSVGLGADICSKQKMFCSLYIYASNIFDVAYQSNMSRLKYADTNNVTGRVGVFNMGRNISFKVMIPITFKK